ncbi:helix-turn-helix domain-containing protein [Gilvimarinus algae]|uniref:Helix-turn-helix domain-containing protein n=1 Tax=Gilvimarinus algae TaxID=3058037 RepID=A0ABT8TG32_9GAMM|nr:helix-turn-helix domain-containing protein [Gilvimarinus sp. SDUM040014]MDO3381282.1 helix-turn-helix domain-containing protein [Gilvimarinus sp. SDUM040014]
MEDRIFNLHDLFLIITIFEVLLLAAYRSVLTGANKSANGWLALFLLVVAIDMLTNLIMWNPAFPVSGWPRERLLALTFTFSHFARGPLFYLYVSSLLRGSSPRGWWHWCHALPAVVAVVLAWWVGVSSADLQSRFDETAPDRLASNIWYLSSLVSVGYALWSVVALNQHMRRAKQRLSSLPSSEMTWLAVLSICFLVSWAWSFLVIFVADTVGGPVADRVGTSHNFIRFLLMNGLIFYNLAYTWSLGDDDNAEEDAPDLPLVSEDVLQAIRTGIDVHKLHLQPSINIDQFSERVGVPPRLVSQAINRELGTRFFEFINHHRVEHAKQLLADPKSARMTILDILLASGFNNKSSFHRFFNRMVGQSPTEYRRENMHSD